MSYPTVVKTLKAAGAEVLCDSYFGDYQGNYYAKVRFNGKIGWVKDSFGSCPACDYLQSLCENQDDQCKSCKYGIPKEDCSDCAEELKKYNQLIFEYGKSLLEMLYTQEQIEEIASENIDWDLEAKEAVEWLRSNCIKFTRARGYYANNHYY